MNAKLRLLSLLAVAVLATVTAAPALARSAVTYHGVFDRAIDYLNCKTDAPTGAVADGQWSVVDRGGVATVAFNIFVDGAHHVSFGGKAQMGTLAEGESFAVDIPTGAGPLRVSLIGKDFTYRIAPYDLFGIACASVTYHGTER